ncbi:MAG: hypothetical protein IJ688_03375 [Treponema sp.]|nr:hypothetical protein [Treponema sp.]
MFVSKRNGWMLFYGMRNCMKKKVTIINNIKRLGRILFVFLIISCNKNYIIESKTVEYREVVTTLKNQNQSKNANKDSISQKEALDDIEVLKYLLTTAYAGYDAACERGLSFDLLNKNLNDIFESAENVKIADFAKLLYMSLSPYIKDSHMYLSCKEFAASFMEPKYWYFSDIYVEQQNNKYIVYSSNFEDIQKGDILSINDENLFLTMKNGAEMYRIGGLSSEIVETIKIADYLIPVKIASEKDYARSFLVYSFETEKTGYLRLANFYAPQTPAEQKMADKYVECAQKFKNKDFIVLDLRSCAGGTDEYSFNFFDELYNGKTNKSSLFALRNSVGGMIDYSSPAIIQSKLYGYWTDSSDESEKEMLINYYQNLLDDYKENPRLEKTVYASPYKIKQKKPDYKGVILVLSDKKNASSGEDTIMIGNYLFRNTEQYVIIGTNSYGALSYANVLEYYLPNSRIFLQLGCSDFTSLKMYKDCHFHGEGIGIIPDYWCSDEDVGDILLQLTGDEELVSKMERILK